MGVSLYPVLERDVLGVDVTEVVGKALARAVYESNLPEVWRLQDFFSVSVDNMLEPLPEGVMPPPEAWFDAAEGIIAVRAALVAVRQETVILETEKAQAWVIADLEKTEQILLLAQEHGVRFHLGMDV